MSPSHHIILGYPNSGKTTFLAALWHILDSGTATSLVLEKITGDVHYLNEIKATWLRCQQAPRTLMASEEMVEIMVRNTETQEIVSLRLPDFSGETFQKMISDRECEEGFADNFDDAIGLIFFVNADRPNDMMSVLDHSFQDDEEDQSGIVLNSRAVEEFDLRKVPEQTRIIEILQILQTAPFCPKLRRLVIAVSAWDVVVGDRVTPQEWVEREMPMLGQYLANNTRCYEVKICGISAQGGEFSGVTRDHLLLQTPSERVVCVWDGKKGSDVTRPLTWLSEDGD